MNALRKMAPNVYKFGELIEDVTAHPATKRVVESHALNFDAGDISSTFYRVYSGILDHLYKHDYDTAREILMDLRKTWTEAMNIR